MPESRHAICGGLATTAQAEIPARDLRRPGNHRPDRRQQPRQPPPSQTQSVFLMASKKGINPLGHQKNAPLETVHGASPGSSVRRAWRASR